MSILRLLSVSSEADITALQRRAQPVVFPRPELKQTVVDMFETMSAAKGIGMAAPMVGKPIRLIIINIPTRRIQISPSTQVQIPSEKHVMVNPQIKKRSTMVETAEEGNLCAPGVKKLVPRPLWVAIDFQDLLGNAQRINKAEGLLGRVIQHEIDLLEGKMFGEPVELMYTTAKL